MIETQNPFGETAITRQQARTGSQSSANAVARDEESPPTFSYTLASTTLQSQASLSLKVHGAAPSNAGGAQNAAQPSNDSQAAQKPTENQTAQQSEQQPRSPASTPAQNEQSPVSARQAAQSVPEHQRIQTPTAPVTALPINTIAVPSTPSAVQSRTEITAARDTQNAKQAASTAKTTQAARPTDTPALSQEFNKLLARRLDNSTAFELRLDPPSLGKLEGRMTVGDDGKSVLALKFDNQSTLDLFSKDEAALRTTLEEAGIELGDHGLEFSLAEHDAPASSILSVQELPTTTAEFFDGDLVSSPSVSSGAIDIRI